MICTDDTVTVYLPPIMIIMMNFGDASDHVVGVKLEPPVLTRSRSRRSECQHRDDRDTVTVSPSESPAPLNNAAAGVRVW
eukprot:3663676-Rhodomonas_salina.1